MEKFDYTEWCKKSTAARDVLAELEKAIDVKYAELHRLKNKSEKQMGKLQDYKKELIQALGDVVKPVVEKTFDNAEFSCAIDMEIECDMPYLIVEVIQEGRFKRFYLYFDKETFLHLMNGGNFELVHTESDMYDIKALNIGDAVLKEL